MKTTSFYFLIMSTHILLFIFAWAGYRLSDESAPVARGAAYAQVRGCIGCHGAPEQPLSDETHRECSDISTMTRHPEYNVGCADVMAYFETIRLRKNFDDRAQININSPLVAGEKLARKYYCFQCHGSLGQGGFKNPKSLKGYVPGYFGSDFRILTRNADPDSVRAWIVNGIDPAVLKKPVIGRIAEFYFRRQAVSMPSYNSLDPEEIEILVNYVIALHRFGPMTAKIVRSYGEQSRSTDRVFSFNSDY